MPQFKIDFEAIGVGSTMVEATDIDAARAVARTLPLKGLMELANWKHPRRVEFRKIDGQDFETAQAFPAFPASALPMSAWTRNAAPKDVQDAVNARLAARKAGESEINPTWVIYDGRGPDADGDERRELARRLGKHFLSWGWGGGTLTIVG
jgi:hypothetical protein